MRRVPIVATALVALAIAAMIALGVWQLGRYAEKQAHVRQLAANQQLPPTAFPRNGGGEDWLFRRAGAMCLRPVEWRIEGAGALGWRRIARCATGAEGPGFLVQLGVSPAPQGHPDWRGGPVTGYIAQAPSHRPLIAGLFDHAPTELMLVADTPLPGLSPNPPADLSSIPNNSFGYAMQWFAFAAIAAVIYALALRSRWRRHRYSHPGSRHHLPPAGSA